MNAGEIVVAFFVDTKHFGIKLHDIGLIVGTGALVDVELELTENLGRCKGSQVGQIASIVNRLQANELHLGLPQEAFGIETRRHKRTRRGSVLIGRSIQRRASTTGSAGRTLTLQTGHVVGRTVVTIEAGSTGPSASTSTGCSWPQTGPLTGRGASTHEPAQQEHTGGNHQQDHHQVGQFFAKTE